MEQDEITQLSHELKYKNKWMSVYEDKIKRKSGLEGIYGVVEKPDFSLIIPAEKDYVYMVEQYRYPVRQKTLEFPQGSMEEKDTDATANARRELLEETGLTADKIEEIGTIFTAVGFSNQTGHVFLATGLSLSKESGKKDAEEEDLICKKIPLEDFRRLVKENRIKDSGTLSAWALFESTSFFV